MAGEAGELDDIFDNELADNMQMGSNHPAVQNNTAKANSNLVMQVNQYVPHFMRIPPKLEKRDLRLFQEDYVHNMLLDQKQPNKHFASIMEDGTKDSNKSSPLAKRSKSRVSNGEIGNDDTIILDADVRRRQKI